MVAELRPLAAVPRPPPAAHQPQRRRNLLNRHLGSPPRQHPLKPGVQLARLQVSTCSRLQCIAACQGVRFNVLYPLLHPNSLLSSAWVPCLVLAGFKGEILCSPWPACSKANMFVKALKFNFSDSLILLAKGKIQRILADNAPAWSLLAFSPSSPDHSCSCFHFSAVPRKGLWHQP